MAERPNIIVIMSDQQRADLLGCYGNRFTSTPNLDHLATRGVVFEHAFTPFPICTPARATMWTGLYPHAHGLIDNYYGIDNLFAEVARHQTTVFDLLRQESDHLLAYFGKWHLGERPHPAFQVWDGFNSRGGHWQDGFQSFQGGVWKPAQQTDACIAFLESEPARERPFVMVQSYYPPHQPYTAPAEFYAPYRGKGVPFAGYYASVTGLDFHTGRILDALERTGLADDTVLIYLSDHGDTFNYREGSKNKFVCFEEAIRVPFVLAWPARVGPGRRIAAPIGLQDLAPTLLDLAGVAIPAWMHGRSLWSLLGDDASDDDWRDAFYIQNVRYADRVAERAIRTERWKLILSADGQSSLFDLAHDPEEELDVYATPREDIHMQYRHFPDFSGEIVALARRLAQEALAIDDPLGVELAEKVIALRSGP